MSEEPDQQQTQENASPKVEDIPNAPINVKVVAASGEEVFFKIKRNTELGKLQGAYASKVGKPVGSIRFLYDGVRVTEHATPRELGMEDNDTIDVMVEQVGGRRP
ncbi:small ubiquitin-like modifier [Amylostereum chailletii]|nr:small ubiquitin-like modifier [Amylostereum chailletii]